MKIEHVALYVHDLEGAKDFFVRYLDGTANTRYHNPRTEFSSYFISFEDGARLEIMNKPELQGQEQNAVHPGYIHVAFSLGSREKWMN